MKKKIISICLAAALMLLTITGASLAYFTDTDKADNVFTTGKVDIQLKENFEQNSKLLPGNQNAVEKEVWIELNEGSEDAYVWYEYMIPAELDSKVNREAVVFVDCYEQTWEQLPGHTGRWIFDYTGNGVKNGLIGTEEISGIIYNKYLAIYTDKLSFTPADPDNITVANTATYAGMAQVRMNSKVETDENKNYTLNGEEIDFDFSKGITVPIRAYGIQAQGFDDVYAAYAAYTE